MRLWHHPYLNITTLCLLGTLPVGVLAADILQISGFTSCLSNSTVSVNTVNVQFDRSAKTVTFELAGSSSQVQNVTALLSITAYGKQVYQTSFDPCAANSRVDQLCPGTSDSRKSVVFFTRRRFRDLNSEKELNSLLFSGSLQNLLSLLGCRPRLRSNECCLFEPWAHSIRYFMHFANEGFSVPAGNFAARGSQIIPSDYVNRIPSIAFSIPDLDGQAKVELQSTDTGKDLACIQSTVKNGKTLNVPAVSYVAVGVAGAALLLTGVSALGSAGVAGGHAASPNFGQVLGYFQSVAMNGMLSVNYPPIYRSFVKNFAFSGGLVPWKGMQTSIDNFRNVTGGNLTANSVQYLENATLVYSDGSASNQTTVTKRGITFAFDAATIGVREVSADVNGTQVGGVSSNGTGTVTGNKVTYVVSGIEGYVEQLLIPQANTFMTVLLIFAIIVAAIAVGVLLFKVILELWALFGSFPKKLTNFRQRYWGLLARTITNLILLLYGVWVLYCIFQFRNGDSWAAKLLAGLTLGVFTAILGYFTLRIWQLARRHKKTQGDASVLYDDKETWLKYSLFYDNYKQGYWWLFMPAIVYMFAKGCVLAAGDGHGLAQTAGQLIIESLMLVLLLWSRPYATKAGNWINIVIQVVRALSVICILVFVEELGIAQSTKTITGVILIGVQSALTAALAILIAVNSIINCCKLNPHRKRRKEAGE